MDRIKNSYYMLFFLTLFFFSGNSFSQTIFISKLTDLAFGDVFIGTANVDVPHTDARAAKFSFYHDAGGKKGTAVTVTFSLPANLVFGANNLPITFDQTHSARHDVDQVAGRTNFDPWAGFKTAKIKSGVVIYVWLGANIPNTALFPSGLYTSTVIMTVAF